MSDIPHYFLYGEAGPSDALAYVHIASLEESLPKHNYEIHPHRHDNLHQLLVVEQGSVLAEVNGKSREERGPCMLSIPPKEVHGFMHQPNVRGYIITIEQAFLQDLFSDTEREEFPGLFRTALFARPQPDSRTAWTMEHLTPQLLGEYRNAEVGQSPMIGAYLKILFILLQRTLEPVLPKDIHRDARIASHEQFMTLLEANYLKHWTVDQYAEQLGLSCGRLNRLCRHYSGQNALEIVHERLLTEAKRQLIYTQHSAKEIGYTLGFKDPGYFSRFFSRKCGITPGKFKANIHQQRQSGSLQDVKK